MCKKLQISEIGFGIGAAAASSFGEGLTEGEFIEDWTHFDPDPAPLNLAAKELKAAGLWPWRQP